jgi:hypothetical protein
MPGKTVAQKLLIKDGYEVLVVDAPKGYIAALKSDCPAADIAEKRKGEADLIQVFVSSSDDLKKKLPPLKDRLRPKGLLWLTYPKWTSDINRDTIREYGGTIGLEAVAIIAVDDTWSALRLKVV